MCISQKISKFALVFEIEKHLEMLLLSNDCVTIPDFGGFVAHYVPARIDEADGMFLPPMRTIGFNPHLTMNDSLLAQSYVEAYDISYPEALRMIEQEVEEIKQQGLNEGVCYLNGIGTLIYNEEGSYNFEPQESGLLTPALYGLNSYEFDLLKPLSLSQPAHIAPSVQEKEDTIEQKDEEAIQQPLIELFEDEDEDDHTVRIKMSWIRNIFATIATIALFFLMTTPVANSDLGSQTMSTLQNSFLSKLSPKDTNVAPAATPVVKTETETDVKLEPEAETKAATKVEAKTETPKQILPQEENPYCIVLASQVKQANAEEFVRVLRHKGFKDTEVYIHNNIVRVVYGHFKSENAAYTELHNLRFEEHFEEAWVLKRKTEG